MLGGLGKIIVAKWRMETKCNNRQRAGSNLLTQEEPAIISLYTNPMPRTDDKR